MKPHTKKASACAKVQTMFMELISENMDLRQQLGGGASNNNSGLKAGVLLDNFSSGGDGRAASPGSPRDNNLQAKVWSLESENALLLQELQQAINSKERKGRDLNSVSH